MDYGVAKELIHTLKELNKTLKSIDKSLSSLDEEHGSAPAGVSAYECEHVRRGVLKDKILCASKEDCFYKEPFCTLLISKDMKKGQHIEGNACIRYGGTE